jgi:hypothetical protein
VLCRFGASNAEARRIAANIAKLPELQQGAGGREYANDAYDYYE